MPTIKVSFYVEDVDDVMNGLPTSGYDKVKVYRSDTEDGSYVEITTAPTRIDLVAGQVQYEYLDTTAVTGEEWYKTAYFNSTTSDESVQSDAIQGTDRGLYCTLQDIRDEGITVTELDDDRALILLWGWQSWFEDKTGLVFKPTDAELELDGDGSRMLLLPLPIITCDALYINDDFTNAVSTDRYAVYNKRGPLQDDRRNPHIMLKRTTGVSSIFTTSCSAGKFEIGDRNQKVVGTFGYVESDGSVPYPVKQAIKILTIVSKEYLPDGDIDQLAIGRRIEEVTDRHRIEFADLFNRLKTWSPTGITMVDDALRKYRAPMRIAAPRTMPRLIV